GKPSAWSNPVSLAVISPLAAPSAPKLENVSRGVELAWTGEGPHYRIFRAEGDGQPQALADSDQTRYLDESTTYGTQYRYMVQAIAGANQWSLLSPPAEITPEDQFPPAVPEGLSPVPTRLPSSSPGPETPKRISRVTISTVQWITDRSTKLHRVSTRPRSAIRKSSLGKHI